MKAFSFLIIFSLLLSCGSNSKSLKIGDKAILTKQCMAADTEDNYDLMTEISVRKDQPALMKLVAAGSVSILNANTTGVIREVKFGKYLFEYTPVLDPVRVWVSSDFVE